ncbi:MAG: 2OG-Fe(II) oxygenase family protein [Actinomycetota bacterium]
MATLALPVVDVTRTDAVEALEQGLASLGFVELIGHGASMAAARALRSACDDFFALDPQQKQAHVDPRPEANRGWRAKGSEALSYSLGDASPPDLFESFNVADDDQVTDHPLRASTPWPEALVPDFRPAAHGWLRTMARLAHRLDALIDEILGTTLAASSGHGPDTMACIDYRPQPDGTEPSIDGQQRMGAHSDYTTFTILHADPVPGLQIIGPDNEWVDVIPGRDSLLLNVGDLLAMLTNDRWPSTLHRVVPLDAGCAPVRRSVAYFHYPNLDVEVAPLAPFGEPRYLPVTVEDHLLDKLAAPKVHQPSTGASTAAGRLNS